MPSPPEEEPDEPEKEPEIDLIEPETLAIESEDLLNEFDAVLIESEIEQLKTNTPVVSKARKIILFIGRPFLRNIFTFNLSMNLSQHFLMNLNQNDSLFR